MHQQVNILMVDDQPSKLMSYEVMLGELGETCDNLAIAAHYSGLLDHLMIDHCDSADAEGLRRAGVLVTITQTVMCTAEDRKGLAREALSAVASGPTSPQNSQPVTSSTENRNGLRQPIT